MADGEAIVTIRERLLKERNALLDLSTRNRLLNTPLRTRHNRAIEIVDEKSVEVFRLLKEGKGMTFLPGVALSEEERAGLDPDDVETGGVPQPENDHVGADGVAARHIDLRLQTRLTSAGLQERLFDIWYDARTLEEEQGVNILYLAVGLLRWYDNENSDVVRHAPLVLLPVILERSSAADKFKLKARGEPPSPNLTLQAKMKAEFSIIVDDFIDEDDLDLNIYYAKLAETVSKQSRWEVLPDAMVLGFFSFAKFLMYRDLDPEHWPQSLAIGDHPLVTALLRDGFPDSAPLVADDAAIDLAIPPIELNHVVDADSSQTVVIAEAAGGRTLVVKGPPGTGKSQTITNIIAAAAARGRKVLFVAEKMAALDVVHRRLRQVGLGPLALELHSNKANKRAILEELRRTKDAVLRPAIADISVIAKLGEAADHLNAFAEQLHAKLSPCGLTPHAILGKLVAATESGVSERYALEGANNWTQDRTATCRMLVAEITERLVSLGAPPLHPWRGVRREAIDPTQGEELGRQIAAIQGFLHDAVEAGRIAANDLKAPLPETLDDFDTSAYWLDAAVELPALDRAALSHPAWRDQVERIATLVAAGRRRVQTRDGVATTINDAGWSASYDDIRKALVIKGGSLFRFLDGNYRAQVALLRSYLMHPLPKSGVARIELVDQIVDAQKAKAAFEALADLGVVFGQAWRGEASDWHALDTLVTWRNKYTSLPSEFWSHIASCDLTKIPTTAPRLNQSLAALRTGLESIIANLDLDLDRAFDAAQTKQISIEQLDGRLSIWRRNLEGLTRFIAFARRGRELERMGAGALVAAVHDGVLDQYSLMPAFDRAYSDVLREVLFDTWPELRAFDGDSQDRAVMSFRQLDKARIEYAKEQIATRHAEARPRGGAGVGPLGVLNAELAKKRAHLPLRQLLDRAGPAIQQLKPVFMMSPLSVAQFLKPGGLHFDLLVMDEASQIEPVDALGAIARAQQLVVVGDERQLPPTAFFKKLTGEDDKDDEGDGIVLQAKDAESILDLCLAKGVPHRMLSWHYRSKHQSLIAVSNREFYESRLFIVPSPYDAVAGMGLKFHLLTQAPYDRGGTRTNPVEAKVVAEAVIRHALDHPDQSLGVGTFSVAQRQAVLNELEVLRRANPAVESFFAHTALEPFFVKNLENIQGDERDVIFISVGYGKNEQGYLAHAFGPLSGEGGERRLNVLISRAKLRCEVFCNFTGADIDLERTRAKGVAALKMFLTFAETGDFGLGEPTGEDHDSAFEAQVCRRLRSLGYDVKAQIGASGFRVDLAIGDTEKPGRFVLGIECDGAQYHASRSARDRDRLRQQVLEAHGWIIHRIWSADWYLRPREEIKKVENAIKQAKAAWRERDEEGYQGARAVPLAFDSSETEDGHVITATVGDSAAVYAAPLIARYQEAKFTVNARLEPHEIPVLEMAEYIARIVEMEGPIHSDEIATRIRTLWGLQRAGTRIRAAVSRGTEVAASLGKIEGGPFYCRPGQSIIVRNRADVASISLRKPDMLPPEEIDTALLKIVGDNFGAAQDELIHAASRAFGFASTSAQLRSVFDDRISHLLAADKLKSKDGLIVHPD